MHAYTITEDTSTDRRVWFEQLQPFLLLNGSTVAVRAAHWDRRERGFPCFLWLTSRFGYVFLADPLGDLPEWLAATAPDWTDR